MSILNTLACSLGRRDEVPNIDLAVEVVRKNDNAAVKELVENLSNKSTAIQNDCIKTLYEIGERKPALISEYVKAFIPLLKSKNNRMQWGIMHTLNTITLEYPEIIYSSLPEILSAAEKGTVITKDHFMNILSKLGAIIKYSETVTELYIDQLKTSFVNQLPTYAENALPMINEKNKSLFLKIITSRLKDVETESKKKRLEKLIKKLSM